MKGPSTSANPKPFAVEKLDYPNRRAYVRKTRGDYYTDAIDYTNVAILEGFERRQGRDTVYEHGEVQVATRVVGYKKIKFYTLENLGYGKIELPDLQFHTTSYWVTFERNLIDHLPYSRLDIIDGVLGLGYALHSMAALHLMCDPHDLNRCVGDRGAKWFLRISPGSKGIYSSFDSPEEIPREKIDLFEPTLFIYDNYPGGVWGQATNFSTTRKTLLEKTMRLISRCECRSGLSLLCGPGQRGR